MKNKLGWLLVKFILAWSMVIAIYNLNWKDAPILLIIPFLIIQDWKTLKYTYEQGF